MVSTDQEKFLSNYIQLTEVIEETFNLLKISPPFKTTVIANVVLLELLGKELFSEYINSIRTTSWPHKMN